MIGYVKGYNISNITKNKANKKGFGVGMESVVSLEILRTNILDALKDGGRVYGLYKKKELVACYIFKKEKTASSELTKPAVISLTEDNLSKIVQGKIDEVSTEESSEVLKAEEITVFRFSEKYVSPQHTEVKNQFEKAILSEIKEYILFGEVKAVIWEENILVSTQINAGSLGSINGIIIGIAMGFMFGMVLENTAIGISLGMIWALAFSTMFKATGATSNKGATTDNNNTDNNTNDK
ncbi:MAG: hypothetical protein UHY68_03745 [Acutalibacteraceae bacterium]|nr:hypothetical protein [Acutalibacteraceae bacterium]